MFDPDFIVRTLIWALIGAGITPLVYRQKDRNPRAGMLIGAGAGALAGLFLLIPLWLLVGRPRKVCPDCRNSIRATVRICPHCDHKFESPTASDKPIHLGYSDLLPFLIIPIIAGTVAGSILYGNANRDPIKGMVSGLLIGGLGGFIVIEALGVFLPRRGKRCPDCKATIPADAPLCPHCRYRFEDIRYLDSKAPSPIFGTMRQLLPKQMQQPLQLSLGWVVIGALILGLLLAPIGLGIRLPGSRAPISAPRATAGIPPTLGPSLGTTRDTIQARFSVFGFFFEPYVNDLGQTGLLGKNKSDQTWLYIMGPQNEVQAVAMTFERPEELSDDLRAAQEENLQVLLDLILRDETDRAVIIDWFHQQEESIWEEQQAEIVEGLHHITLFADSGARWLSLSLAPAE